jgi:SET domain-containing protein 6
LFHEDEFLVMKSTRPIRAGDEIFNDYGLLPRSDLLRMYGYITDNYAQYDVVELSSQVIYDVAQEIRKRYKRPGTSVRIRF